MADNLGLMVAVGGAALIGFAFLSLGKDELAQASEGKEFPMSDLNEDWVPDNMNPDGTVPSRSGKNVIPTLPTKAQVKIQDCNYVDFDEGGSGICGHDQGYETNFPKATDPEPWYGILGDFIFGGDKRNEIPARAETSEDSKLYMFSGEPIIESISITKPEWLEEQDKDSFI